MKEKKKITKITHIDFVRESGIQVKYPNGKFLKYVRDSKHYGDNSSRDSDFHIIGIKEAKESTLGVIIKLENQTRLIPWGQIACLTLETVEDEE